MAADPVKQIVDRWKAVTADQADGIPKNVWPLVPGEVPGETDPRIMFPMLVYSSSGIRRELHPSGRSMELEAFILDFRHTNYPALRELTEKYRSGIKTVSWAYQADTVGIELVVASGIPVTPRRVALATFRL